MESNQSIPTNKRNLEALIIGEVILENKFALVANILSQKNFGSYPGADHKIIWSVLEKMYPTIPIDLVTATRKLQEWYTINYAFLLTGYTLRIGSTNHIRYHAIILLEMDIRSKVLAVLDQIYITGRSRSEFTKAAEIYEIKQYIENVQFDLFESVIQVSKYLESTDYTEECSAVQDLVSYIPKKIEQVQKLCQLESCMEHLNRLADICLKHQSLIQKLVDAIQKIYLTDDFDDQLIDRKISELLNSI